jgi:hypothetical protein
VSIILLTLSIVTDTQFLDYLYGKEKLDEMMIGHVNNVSKLSRKEQLEAYDGCGRLRPVWDEIASKYDAVITPSVPDIAPSGLGNTGDAVSNPSP